MGRISYGSRRGESMLVEDVWRGLDGDRDDLMIEPGRTSSRMATAILAVYGCLLLVLGMAIVG